MKLMPDTQAPALSLPLVGGGTWTLSGRAPEAFSMIVVYRGLHCPVCETYLGKLQTVASDFAAKGVDLLPSRWTRSTAPKRRRLIGV